MCGAQRQSDLINLYLYLWLRTINWKKLKTVNCKLRTDNHLSLITQYLLLITILNSQSSSFNFIPLTLSLSLRGEREITTVKFFTVFNSIKLSTIYQRLTTVLSCSFVSSYILHLTENCKLRTKNCFTPHPLTIKGKWNKYKNVFGLLFFVISKE